ncbi:hypothetical protein I302_107835 [Kwoniella bestiolae CBS 10118]|uniref:Major facilitator superfamily (MFS) profile domain-containing protein n=1 Tax=Kwoniella bestiolae CBS 10118 TaxID=1296100 RepID=A0A1B9FXE7_9TREE|nr:hypothetical protein I302_06425 [Kwoniella bestiolae CBS 10118]OCF23443.1 hypothetical protein I302_06425 [Kwoniella bestiolae CBS 10118]
MQALHGLHEEDVDKKGEIETLEHHQMTPEIEYKPEYITWSLFTTLKKFWRSILFCGLVALGATFDGYAISVPGSIISQPAFIKQFGTIVSPVTGALELDALHVSAWSACLNGAQIFGMFTGPACSDRFGRKAVMWGLSFFLIIAAVLEIVAKDWRVYAVAKFLCGIATGWIQSGLTVYIAEVAPVRARGAVLAAYSFAFALGQLAAAIGLQIIATHDQYRVIFYSEFVLLGLFIPALIFAPETPTWAARRGNETKAKNSMRLLYGNVESYDVDREYLVLKHIIEEEGKNKSDVWFRQYLECFQGVNLRRTIISFLPLAYQQFVGLALFFAYTTYFFQLAGYPRPFEASLIQTCILLLFLVISFFVIDKVGRRPLLLGGGAIMASCCFSTAGIGFMEKLPGAALVFLTCLWTASYALSVGSVGWAYVADTASPRLRAKTAGMAAAGTAMFGLIFQYTVPIMLSPQQANWGLKIGFFFGPLCVLGWIIVYFFVPETKGRTYPELDELFEKRISTRQFGSYITEVQKSINGSASNYEA